MGRYRYETGISSRAFLVLGPDTVLCSGRFSSRHCFVRHLLYTYSGRISVVKELTDQIRDEVKLNLFDSINLLTLLKKLPEDHLKLVHQVRKAGNGAAHPLDEEDWEPATPEEMLDIALKNYKRLKVFLKWYRRNARRSRITYEEWNQVKDQFQPKSAA